jgi:hypothetical protein
LVAVTLKSNAKWRVAEAGTTLSVFFPSSYETVGMRWWILWISFFIQACGSQRALHSNTPNGFQSRSLLGDLEGCSKMAGHPTRDWV